MSNSFSAPPVLCLFVCLCLSVLFLFLFYPINDNLSIMYNNHFYRKSLVQHAQLVFLLILPGNVSIYKHFNMSRCPSSRTAAGRLFQVGRRFIIPIGLMGKFPALNKRHKTPVCKSALGCAWVAGVPPGGQWPGPCVFLCSTAAGLPEKAAAGSHAPYNHNKKRACRCGLALILCASCL